MTFQVGHVDHPQSRVNLPEVKEILADHEASMVKRIKENLGADIQGQKSIYQWPYPSRFDWTPSPPYFRLSNFVKFNEDDSRSTWEHVSQYSLG
jgi:hypothetical protein